MHLGNSPMGYFALGIGALHSTTGSSADFIVGGALFQCPLSADIVTHCGPEAAMPHARDYSAQQESLAGSLVLAIAAILRASAMVG